MHHDSEKSQAIRSSVTSLGLLKKKTKKKERKKMNKCVGVIFRTPTYNMIPMKLKAACSKRRCPCTARLDVLNH